MELPPESRIQNFPGAVRYRIATSFYGYCETTRMLLCNLARESVILFICNRAEPLVGCVLA